MPLEELQGPRLRYTAAHAAYMHSVHALTEASERGVIPSPAVLGTEQRALDELTFARQDFLDALFAHSRKRQPLVVRLPDGIHDEPKV